VTGRGVLAPALLALAAGAAATALHGAADGARAPEARAARGLPPLGIVNALAVDLLWLRADALFAEGRWPEMGAAYEAAGRAEPRLAASFEYRGFHLAWNLAGNAATEGDRDRWVEEGLRVLDEGIARNPGDASLLAWSGFALFDRTRRFPSLVPRLKERRGKEPWDEAVARLEAAVARDPADGRAAIWLSDVLGARGRRARGATPAGSPCPAAAADFARAAAVLRALAAAPDLPADGRALAESLAADYDGLRKAAE
jgi:tetratricopeptide (TPR) repeat protein